MPYFHRHAVIARVRARSMNKPAPHACSQPDINHAAWRLLKQREFPQRSDQRIIFHPDRQTDQFSKLSSNIDVMQTGQIGRLNDITFYWINEPGKTYADRSYLWV